MVLDAILAISKENNLLPNEGLLLGLKGIGASSIVLQTYSATVLAQPDLKLDILPELPTKQKEARDAADIWINKTNKSAIGSLVDVQSYANKFGSYTEALLPLAEEIESGDNSRLDLFIKGLQELIVTAQEKAVNASNLSDDVRIFQGEVAANVKSFSEAEKVVQEQITGRTGKIAQMRKDLSNLNSRMKADITKIAVGAASDVIGVGLIILGATTAIPSGGATTLVVGAGITLLTGGSTAMALASQDIADAQKAYSDVLTQTVALEQEVAAFDTVAHQITSNEDQATDAFDAAGMMKDGWVNIAENYSQTIDDLKDKKTEYLSLKLMAAKNHWDNLGQQAHMILMQGSLSVEIKAAADL